MDLTELNKKSALDVLEIINRYFGTIYPRRSAAQHDCYVSQKGDFFNPFLFDGSKKTSTSKRSGKIAPVKGSHYTPPKGTEAPLPPSFYHPEWVKEDREQYKKSYGTLEGWEPPDL